MLISGRRLAIDYGDVRIGMSISDPTCIVVSPLTTIINSGEIEKVLTRLTEIVEENEIVVVYVGLPLHLSGTEGESAAKVREFAQQLSRTLPPNIAVRLLDERLSTASAEREARDTGKRISRENIDQWAAVSILENALNSEKLSGQLAGIAL